MTTINYVIFNKKSKKYLGNDFRTDQHKHGDFWQEWVSDPRKARLFYSESVAIGVAACILELPLEDFEIHEALGFWETPECQHSPE